MDEVTPGTPEPASAETNASAIAESKTDHTALPKARSHLERAFEALLWSSRLAVLLAVLGSVAVAIAMFYVATVDTVLHLLTINDYASARLPPAQHEALRTQTIANVVEAIDGYLLATVMLIFAFGLYEIFISRIDRAGKGDRARVLVIHTLNDLKNRLGQVVLLILVVKFFEGALALTIRSLYDLLVLAAGILLIAVSLYLTHKQEGLGGAASKDAQHDGNGL